MEKKKNSSRFIIPPSYFKKLGITPIPVKQPQTQAQPVKPTVVENRTAQQPEKKAVEVPKITINTGKKATSGLSLKSIRAKKEHLIRQMDVVIDEESLPREDFHEDDFYEHWYAYIKKLENDGKMNLASILSIDKPKLDGTTIHLTFPTSTNKVEVERQQYDLMQYLRQRLKNFDITLEITVNEVMESKFAYTPDEKYNKLKERNPHIELLRKTFDLDL